MIHIKLQLRVPTPIQISPAKCSRNPVYIFCNFPLWLDFTCNLHAYVLNGVEFVETTRESIIEDPCEQIVHAVKIHAIPTVYLVANVCIGALLNFKGIQNDANYLEYTPGMESGLAEICGVEKGYFFFFYIVKYGEFVLKHRNNEKKLH